MRARFDDLQGELTGLQLAAYWLAFLVEQELASCAGIDVPRVPLLAEKAKTPGRAGAADAPCRYALAA